MGKRFFCGRNFRLPLGGKTYIMGILNITPDSFSDGGKFFSPERALAHALAMERDGADMIDVGACSTRPGSLHVSVEEEIRRLSCLAELCDRLSTPVSVDTYHPETASFAIRAGAAVINDVSGRFSPEMAALVKASGCGYIVMHAPRAQSGEDASYPDGAAHDVNLFFARMLRALTDAGIDPARICLDPGFGFSKTTADNIDILKHLNRLRTDGVCLMAALSRKRFIGDLAGIPSAEDRDLASAAACVAAVQQGADLVRVHNVADCAQAIKIADAVYRS